MRLVKDESIPKAPDISGAPSSSEPFVLTQNPLTEEDVVDIPSDQRDPENQPRP